MAAAPQPAQKALTLPGLRIAARQTTGLQRVPLRLQSAISAFLAEQSSQNVKSCVARLAMNMRDRKQMARGKLSSVEELDFSPLVKQAAAEFMDDSALHLEQAPLKYEAQQTVAYVAGRLPSVYAAVHRVLSEVSRRVPDFKPVTVLDYGSGPGTVFWAARDVWLTGVKHVNMVEPSPAMAHACRFLLKDQEDLPTMQSYSSLQTFAKSCKRESRLHDMVVASYALGELPSMAHRISTVRQLWALTNDVLVLIEPGTPEGFQVVQEMRKHVLQMAKKKVRKQRQRDLSQICPMNQSDTSFTGEKTDMGGAFVVAPCAHDGPCPMQMTGSWCHFAQRVERTLCQRTSKQLTKPVLRGYEDEKFSFVVLRHGVRPRALRSRPHVTGELPNNWHSDLMPEDNDVSAEDDADVLGGGSRDWSTGTTYLDVDKQGDPDDMDIDQGFAVEGQAETEPEMKLDVFQGFVNLKESSGIETPQEANDMLILDRQTDDAKGEQAHGMGQETADPGGGWARIVRPPMKRGGHVYLDLCCSTRSDGSEGKLERMIAVRSGARALYWQARKSRWGDLWPY